MDILTLEMLGPVLVALATVPLLGGIKRFFSFVDDWSPYAQRAVAVIIATLLTMLGSWLSVDLPESLQLFTGETVEALVAAAMAMAIHAGNKAKQAGS